MIIASTSEIEGRPIKTVVGLVASEVIFGANMVRDFIAGIADATGGRVSTLERLYSQARVKAIGDLKEQGRLHKADAIVGLRLEYQVLGAQNGMVMVAAYGTAVRLGISVAEQEKQLLEIQNEELNWSVEIDGKTMGPFSLLQISQLVYENKLDMEAVAKNESGEVRRIEELLGD